MSKVSGVTYLDPPAKNLASSAKLAAGEVQLAEPPRKSAFLVMRGNSPARQAQVLRKLARFAQPVGGAVRRQTSAQLAAEADGATRSAQRVTPRARPALLADPPMCRVPQHGHNAQHVLLGAGAIHQALPPVIFAQLVERVMVLLVLQIWSRHAHLAKQVSQVNQVAKLAAIALLVAGQVCLALARARCARAGNGVLQVEHLRKQHARTALPDAGVQLKAQHPTRHAHRAQLGAGVTRLEPHSLATFARLGRQTLGWGRRWLKHANLVIEELGVRKVPGHVTTALLAVGLTVLGQLHVICAQVAPGHQRKLHQVKILVCFAMLDDGAQYWEPAMSVLVLAVLVAVGPTKLVPVAVFFAARDVPVPCHQLPLRKPARFALQEITADLELQGAAAVLLEPGVARTAAAAAAAARQAAGAVWKAQARAMCAKHAGPVVFLRPKELLRSPLVKPAGKDTGQT